MYISGIYKVYINYINSVYTLCDHFRFGSLQCLLSVLIVSVFTFCLGCVRGCYLLTTYNVKSMSVYVYGLSYEICHVTLLCLCMFVPGSLW
jgi:hypothetical protein